jgi:hypothetical protein
MLVTTWYRGTDGSLDALSGELLAQESGGGSVRHGVLGNGSEGGLCSRDLVSGGDNLGTGTCGSNSAVLGADGTSNSKDDGLDARARSSEQVMGSGLGVVAVHGCMGERRVHVAAASNDRILSIRVGQAQSPGTVGLFPAPEFLVVDADDGHSDCVDRPGWH